jgi:polysaccharide biosynthesis protein PslG
VDGPSDQFGHWVCGAILRYWHANGLDLGQAGITPSESLALFGYPITDLVPFVSGGRTFQVQWFERARLELHPENAPPYDVLGGLLGREAKQ